jgi:TonB family protein
MLETLGLLPKPAGRLRSFIESLALNLIMGALLFLFAVAAHKAPSAARYVSTQLIFPSRLPHPSTRIRVPQPRLVTQLPPKIKIPTPQPPKPEMIRMKTAAMPELPPSPAKTVIAPPQPKVGLFAAPKTTSVASNRSAPLIKSGGFGDPSGVVPNANAARPATIAAIGSFENTPGPGHGAGGSRGTVAVAGFTNGVAGGATPGTGSGSGTITTGGFGANGIGGAVASVARNQPPRFTPPEVLFEPRPQYTEEARQLRIQGEITLQVRFGASGKVEVLRVVRGLGHGLDEEAALVAQQIRFKPAEKDGQPADHVTFIHILFQLA